MRKIIGFYNGPFCGTDSCTPLLVSDEATEDQISDMLLDWAYDEHENWVEYDDEGNCLEYAGPDFHWEEYDPEKHDGLRVGGGSFEEDFEREAKFFS